MTNTNSQSESAIAQKQLESNINIRLLAEKKFERRTLQAEVDTLEEENSVSLREAAKLANQIAAKKELEIPIRVQITEERKTKDDIEKEDIWRDEADLIEAIGRKGELINKVLKLKSEIAIINHRKTKLDIQIDIVNKRCRKQESEIKVLAGHIIALKAKIN